MDRWTQAELMAADRERDAAEVSAAELGAEMAEAAQAEHTQDAMREEDEMLMRASEGIGELYEDGWTAAELQAFVMDENAQEVFARGKSVARAACAYLRAKLAAGKKHGVPTARTIATSGYAKESPIDAMTDEEFDAFSRKAQMAMMSGKKVRI